MVARPAGLSGAVSRGAVLTAAVVVLAGCAGKSPVEPVGADLSTNHASASTGGLDEVSFPLPPEVHARLAPMVSRVTVEAVHAMPELYEFNMMNTPVPTASHGRIIELAINQHLKTDFNLWTTLLAVVPDALDVAADQDTANVTEPYQVGNELIVFFEPHYRGPGDSNCNDLRLALDPNYNRVVFGFAVPYEIVGDMATSRLANQLLPVAELIAAIDEGSKPRRPAVPDPLPAASSMTAINGVHLALADAMEYGTGVVAEVEVTDEGAPLFNTESGLAPEGPPGGSGSHRISASAYFVGPIAVEMGRVTFIRTLREELGRMGHEVSE